MAQRSLVRCLHLPSLLLPPFTPVLDSLSICLPKLLPLLFLTLELIRRGHQPDTLTLGCTPSQAPDLAKRGDQERGQGMRFSRGKSWQEDPKQLLQHLPQSRRAPAHSHTTLCMSPLPLPVCPGRPLLWLLLPDCGPSEKCHQCSCDLWWDCVRMSLSFQQCRREMPQSLRCPCWPLTGGPFLPPAPLPTAAVHVCW